MKSRWIVFCGVLLVLVGASSVVAQEGAPLTEDEAVRRALARPAFARVLRGEELLAEAEAGAASALANPSIGFEQESDDAGGAKTTERFFTLSQRIDTSGRWLQGAELASLRGDAAKYAAERARAELTADVRERFYALLYRQERVRSVREWLGRIEEVTARVRERARRGYAALYDQRRLEREQASARALFRTEEAALSQARESLAALVGEVPGVSGEVLPVDAPGPQQGWLSRAKGAPALQTLKARKDVAEAQNRTHGRWWAPEIELSGGYKQVSSAGGDGSGYVVGASAELPVFGETRAEARRAQGVAEITSGEYELARAELLAQVRGHYSRALTLHNAAREFEAETIRTSQQLTQITEQTYQTGEIGILELLDAYTAERDGYLQQLELALAARLARIELEQITGGTPQ